MKIRLASFVSLVSLAALAAALPAAAQEKVLNLY